MAGPEEVFTARPTVTGAIICLIGMCIPLTSLSYIKFVTDPVSIRPRTRNTLQFNSKMVGNTNRVGTVRNHGHLYFLEVLFLFSLI